MLTAFQTVTTPEAAIRLQEEARSLISLIDNLGPIRHVAGVDLGFEGEIARAAIAVLTFPELALHESAIATAPITFPYVPGLLGFREVPVALQALSQLKTRPDLLLCDGNGYLHPRRFGSACQLGLFSDLPTIGIAKTPYIGEHEPVGRDRGAWQPVVDDGEIIGAAVRTQTDVKPIYVSIGHRISLESAIQIALQCSPNYRLPETTRWADHLAGDRKEKLS